MKSTQFRLTLAHHQRAPRSRREQGWDLVEGAREEAQRGGQKGQTGGQKNLCSSSLSNNWCRPPRAKQARRSACSRRSTAAPRASPPCRCSSAWGQPGTQARIGRPVDADRLVTVTIKHAADAGPKSVITNRIDSTHSNPQAAWIKQGSPAVPSAAPHTTTGTTTVVKVAMTANTAVRLSFE